MKDTLLLFSCQPTWKDRLLRCLTLSRWTALDIVLPQTTGNPVFVMGLDPESGVVSQMPLSNRIVQASHAGLMTLFGVSPEPIVEALSSQIGKPFDWRRALPKVSAQSLGWRQPDAWHPAELMAWAFGAAHIQLFRDPSNKLSLRQFWTMADSPIVSFSREILKPRPTRSKSESDEIERGGI